MATQSSQLDALWKRVAAHFSPGNESMHGLSHWKRVEQNGLFLAQHSGARIDVVRLFAVYFLEL